MVLSMDRWIGKVAVVTGASRGIGAALAKRLVKDGLLVVGIDRRVRDLEEIARELEGEKGKLYPLKCDVMVEEEILNVFNWIERKKLGPVHIMINNAGVSGPTNLVDGDLKIWREIIDTNVLGLCIGTREAVRNMKANNVDGHIIHMNSIGGHVIPYVPVSNIYPATKHAVTALTETLRKEFDHLGLKIKITSISPGLVRTNIADNLGEEYKKMMATWPSLDCEEVVDAVIYALSTGPNCQVQDIMIKPIKDIY